MRRGEFFKSTLFNILKEKKDNFKTLKRKVLNEIVKELFYLEFTTVLLRAFIRMYYTF